MSKISKKVHGRPFFNYEIGAVTDKGFGKRIRVYTTGQGKIELDRERTGDNPKDLAELGQKSEEYILAELQKNEDIFRAHQQRKEQQGEFKPRKKEYKGPRQRGDERRQKRERSYEAT
jgi:hypothetical protein